MAADVELPPLPPEDDDLPRYGMWNGQAREGSDPVWFQESLEAYGAACAAAKGAEIEALRAEIERLRDDVGTATRMHAITREHLEAAEARAEQMAEALRELSEVCRAAIKAGDWKVDGACDPDCLLIRADDAIDQARGKGEG